MKRKTSFRDGPFTYHQEITLTVDTLTNLGHGLGRVDNWVVMVPFTVPGETVRARVFRNHKNYSEADLVEVLQASPDRVEPACPLFGQCGGCQYQMMSYEAQLRWKRQQVRELLAHMAGVEVEVAEVIGSPQAYGYRSKITPHFEKPKAGVIREIGFLRHGRRFDLVDVAQCPLATDAINRALPTIREEVRGAAAGYRSGATLLIREGAEGVVTDPQRVITERVGELELQFLARDFFQNNPFVLPLMVNHVVEQAASFGVAHLVDAYCGSGLFALAASRRFARVSGVEISESSIVWARANAVRNGIENCTFYAGDAAAIFAQVTEPGSQTVVIIDPPRKGCDPDFLRQLFEFGPVGVVYVSCNPATQIRDLAAFIEANYAVEQVQPMDLFPQTKHLECVITLKKGA